MENTIPEIGFPALGKKMYSMIAELYPICRSITGGGVRQTLDIIGRYIPLEVHQVPSGTKVFDWTVPKEWNIQDAYVKDSRGEKVIDFRKSNLHILNYSIPVHRKVKLEELKAHLYSLPDHPDWIPYRTSYYSENWGFCLSQNELSALKDDEHEVFIDTTLAPGFLDYGECYIPGKLEDEVLISCHLCHPSLCNDNLSGIALATILAETLKPKDLRYSYRFLFIPGTIGSIAWLSENESRVSQIKHGLVAACVGDPGNPHYKRSRQGDAEIDRVVEYVLKSSGEPFDIEDFSPYGYDERQYCSPGFNLAIGCLSRTPYGRYPEYHTSADNLDLVQPDALSDSLKLYVEIIEILEANRRYRNTNPNCEPQLGKRGLYGAFGGHKEAKAFEMALLWVLNYSDGQHDLLEIAEMSRLDFGMIKEAADLLQTNNLLVSW
jgi:aminopeptidase-like protein